MSSLDRIKKKRQQLSVENNKSYSSADKSIGRINMLRDEIKTTGKIDYGDIAPINLDNPYSSKWSKKAYANSERDSLLAKQKELQEKLKNYDRKENPDRQWWEDDKNVFENLISLPIKAFSPEFSKSKYLEDPEYDKLVKEYDAVNKAVEDNAVATKKYDDDIYGFVEKSLDVFAGNVQTGLKGVESTAKKILSGAFNKEVETDTDLTLNEKLSQKVSTEAEGGEKVYYDVVGSVGRMFPQMMVSNPAGATAMGFANYGGGAYNQAKREGYSEEEALKYGLAIGSLEMATSKALGTFSSVYGKTKLGNASQEVIDKVIPKVIKNKQVRNVLGQFVAEGGEEFLQEYIEGITRDTLLDNKGFLKSTWENVSDPDKFANALYSGFVGGLTGSTMAIPSQIDAYKYEKATGRDAETGLTVNEQKVVDSEVAKRTEGKNLTKKQIVEIETEVKNELEKGYISTDTIESVLGGDTYNNLKSTRDNKTKIENEIKELESKKNAEITVKEMEHLKDLREQLKGIDTNTLETDLQGKMGQIIKSDGYLQRSYQEKANKGQKFTYEANKITNENEKAVYESATKVMNNTNRTHEFVEKVAKLSKDRGTKYEFTNNAELEKSNYDVKGRQVNGLVTVEENGNKKILINVDSSKALNTIVGHETTHLLEGTQEYQELQDAIFNYAKTKGDFDTRQATLTELYQGIENANIDSELTADLVGDYLFTDADFISELSVQKPTVFQKIRELIDDLVVRFKGTKEEKALREVQKKFKEAYRQQSDTQSDTKYSMAGKKAVDRLAKNDSSYQYVIDNYNEALKMKEEGKTNREIWQKTLWIQDEEGKWKIEVSDRDARLDTKAEKNKKYKLKDVLNHEKLYEIYPETKNITVKFRNIKDNVDPDTGKHRMIAGYYNALTGTISVNNKLLEMTNGDKHIINTILHEVQHKIQKYEGFNYGYKGSDEAGYFNNLGEREAKDTERRRNLSYKERMQIAPVSLFEENTNSLYNNANGGNRSEVNQKNKTILSKSLYATDERSIDDRRGNRADVEEIENPYYIDEELDNSSFFNTQYSVSDNQGRTLTKEQQEYFKDSKVRDEEGRLLEVYHGTNKEFTVFNNRYGRHYFTTNNETAKGYGKNIVSGYVNITNPLIIDLDGGKWSSIPLKLVPDQNIIEYIKNDYGNPKLRNVSTTEITDAAQQLGGYDGVIYKNIYDNADSNRNILSDSIVTFNSNQFKNVDNTNPTSNEDIRYSLSEDTQGRKLSDNQKEYFKNSEIIDDKGNLKVLYHGTPFGKFTTFKGNLFFFSEDYRFAEDYANSKSFEQGLDGDINVVEAYLNAKNVFDVTDPNDIQKLREVLSDEINFWGRTWDKETLLKKLQRKDTLPPKWKSEQIEGKQFGDYIGDDRDGYNTDMFVGVNEQNEIVYISQERDLQKLSQTEKDMFKEQLMNGKEVSYVTYQTVFGDLTEQGIHEKISELQKQGEEYKKENGFENEAIAYYIKELEQTLKWVEKDLVPETKHKLTPKTTTQESTELTDIDNWTYFETAFDSNTRKDVVDIIRDLGYDAINIYEEGKSNYIVFNPNQIKNVNNENPTDNPDINMSLSNQNEQRAEAKGNYNVYGEDVKYQEAIAPLQEEIQTLTETVNELKEQIAPVRDEYAPLTEEDLPYLEQQYNEAPKEDIAPPETEENIPVVEDEITSTKSLFETRNYEEVGNRKVNAYQYDNPEVKPYFQEAARGMIDDLAYSLKGQRFYNDQVYYDTNGEQGFFGINRFTANDIAELLDGVDGKYKLSYKDIEKGLKAIVEDHGAENNAASKRIEFYLDKRLREGFTTLDGVEIPANQEYLELLEAIETTDYYNSIPIGEAPVQSVLNPNVRESNVPIKEIKVNDSGQGADSTDKNTAKQLTIDGKEEDLVTKTKKELRKALLGTEAQKEFITNALDNAKNRSMALMNNTDTIRNTELVFGRDAGNVINEVVFQKEIDNEADSIAWQNKERQEIKDLGIKARSKESAAVQKYGEKQYVNEYNEVVAYGDVELAKEFSDVATQEKIKNAAKVIRSKYDAYIDEANNVLTKLGFEPIKKRNDYMRHFQELNDVFTRYGIPFNAQNMQEHTLPTDINGLTEFWSPQKNYFANMQPRKGMKTTYDAITGVDGYISGIANLIYHTEDIQRGRAFEELIRETYGEDKGWDNLENLPEELQQARMEKIQDNHLSNYAAWVHEWTNNVAGKKNKIDRSVEAMFGRKAFAVLDEVRKQVGSNMIGLNLSSSLTNLIAPVQAASKTNKLAVLKGTADTIKNMFVKDNFMDNNKFLTARMGTDMLSQNAWQKMQNAGFVFMKGMDWFSSNQIVRSKYYELRAKGMSEAQAHSEAGKFAARILGDRTKGANAQLYNSKLVGLVTQFQLEVNNQLYSQFYDTYHESKEAARGNALKTAAGMTFTLGQLFALTHLFGQTFEAIAGYNPTFDVVEMLKTAFGWGDEEEEEKPLSERLKSAADQLVDALPYVNILTGGGRIPVASGIPNLVGVATGGKDQYGNELTLEDEMKKLLYLIPPTGGNQFKKTTQGLAMFDEDLPVTGSYTDSGNLRFPVEDTLGNRVQAAIFGQWANKNAGDYFDNERQPLKEKQIQEYADLDMPIKDYWKYREGLKEQSTIEEKFEYINGLDVTDEQKNIMINNATGRENPIDMSGYDNFGSYDEFDYATKNPDKYRVIEQIDTFDNYNSYKEDIASIKEQFSEDNGYSTKDRKAAVQQYINSLSLDIPQKIMLEKMAGGYSIKDYENYMFSYIQSLPMTAEEKQAMHKQLFD